MVDFTLTDEQLTLQRTARDLATREIAPIAEQVERMDHASTAPWDLVQPVFQTDVPHFSGGLSRRFGGRVFGCVEGGQGSGFEVGDEFA